MIFSSLQVGVKFILLIPSLVFAGGEASTDAGFRFGDDSRSLGFPTRRRGNASGGGFPGDRIRESQRIVLAAERASGRKIFTKRPGSRGASEGVVRTNERYSERVENSKVTFSRREIIILFLFQNVRSGFFLPFEFV
jgi:hypothetical protein